MKTDSDIIRECVSVKVGDSDNARHKEFDCLKRAEKTAKYMGWKNYAIKKTYNGMGMILPSLYNIKICPKNWEEAFEEASIYGNVYAKMTCVLRKL